MAVASLYESSVVPDRVLRVVASVPTWWARRCVAAGLSRAWQEWRRALPPPPVPLKASPVEELHHASPYEIGEAYVEALEPRLRLEGGRHYTPALLAAALWEQIAVAGHEEGPVVDPASGAGALLLPALRAFVASARDPVEALESVTSRFAGTDLDPVAVWLGNALLASELLPLWAQVPAQRRRVLPCLLRIGDGLAVTKDAPEIVVMNPPYGRTRLESAARMRWSESLYGHANRYALFLHAAIERVRPGGLVAAVIPTSFLGGAYYQRLRSFIAKEAPLVRLAFVDARSGVFAGDVLQETCLAVFRKGARPAPIDCAQIGLNGGRTLSALSEAPAPAGPFDLPWLLPRQPRDGPLVAAASRLKWRLADYGWRASTGPLVWNRHKPQIFSMPCPGRVPILWAADLADGRVVRNPARDSQRWILLRPCDEFMRLTDPALLVQRTTAPEQPRRLVAAALDAEMLEAWGGTVVVENHVNVLRCSDPRSPLTPSLLSALLASETFDRLYRCSTGTVAVSAYELEALPFPPPSTLRRWQHLAGRRLAEAVSSFYADDSS